MIPSQIPTVNVVVSFDYELMNAFSKSGSLKNFKKIAFAKAQAATRRAGGTRAGRTTAFFENTVNSNLLSLKHKFNTDSDGALITLEFLDPQVSFEEVALDFDIDIDPVASTGVDPLGNLLQKLKADLYLEENKLKVFEQINAFQFVNRSHERLQQYGINIFEYRLYLAKQKDIVKRLLNQAEPFKDADFVVEASKKMIRLLSQQSKSSLMQQAVYIAYGTGENLREGWCMPQAFGNLYRAEYNFTGDGARILKLIFGGKGGVGSILTKLGTTPLGENGLVISGRSKRLFDSATQHSEVDKYIELYEGRAQASTHTFRGDAKEEVGEALSPSIPSRSQPTLWAPSIHKAFRECMTSFIQAALPPKYKGNVIVLFPNLDKALKGAWASEIAAMSVWMKTNLGAKRLKRGYATNTQLVGSPFGTPYQGTPDFQSIDKFAMVYLMAYQNLAESFGLQLSRKSMVFPNKLPPGPGGQQVRDWFQPVENPVIIGVNTSEALALDINKLTLTNWWERQNIALHCQSSMKVPFMEKLASVATAVDEAIRSSVAKSEDAYPVNVNLFIETDQQVLAAMYEQELIQHPEWPAVIWGDLSMKKRYIDAMVLEDPIKGDIPSGADPLDILVKEAVGKIEKDLHLVDRLAGIDDVYMDKVINILQPVPYMGSFGPVGRVGAQDPTIPDYFLPKDENIVYGEEEQEHLKRSPIATSRMPIFAYGVKNSNILKVKMEIDNIYTSLLHMGQGTSVLSQNKVIDFIMVPVAEGPISAAVEAKDIFMLIKEFLEKGKFLTIDPEIPQEFKTIIDKYYYAGWGGNVFNPIFSNWAEVFRRSGVGVLDELKSDLDGTNDKEAWIRVMWIAFVNLYKHAGTRYLGITYTMHRGKNPLASTVRSHSKLMENMVALQLNGKITTLPMFTLSSPRQAMGRQCLLLAREPQFTQHTKPDTKNKVPTWFSGIYYIYGWEHKISQDTVDSEFLITRDIRSGATIDKDS